MTPKERIDKRAKEMHKPILKEVKRLESELSLYKVWTILARTHGVARADSLTDEHWNWKP